MRRKPLPDRELSICRRLGEARRFLGLTQDAVAKELGMPRARWRNYEQGKALVRCDLALAFCRQFIISEEWLATGAYQIVRTAPWSPALGDMKMWEEEPVFFFRQSLDLCAEMVRADFPRRGAFIEVFRHVLAPLCIEQVQKTSARSDTFVPWFSPLAPWLYDPVSASPACLRRYLDVVFARIFRLLEVQALKIESNPRRARGDFFLKVFELLPVIYRRYLGEATLEVQAWRFKWLADLVNSIDQPIGDFAFHGLAPELAAALKNIHKPLDSVSENRNTPYMKTEMQRLIESVRKLVERPGQRLAIARSLGVSPSRISDWLSGICEPGGQSTLKLLRWVEEQGRNK